MGATGGRRFQEGKQNEGSRFGQENLPQLQDHPPARGRSRHLQRPAAQAAARL